MVRLILTLTPIVCVFAAIAFSRMFEVFLDDEEEESGNPTRRSHETKNSSKTDKHLYDKPSKPIPQVSSTNADAASSASQQPESSAAGSGFRPITFVLVIFVLYLFVSHCVWVSSYAYSSPSIVLASYDASGSRFILDDFREAYYWLWQNTKPDSRIMSWWDYGYQIAGMANRTTLVDNNTWNNSHIALVGKAMASNESEAYKTIQSLDVDYVLVIFGGYIGYSGDDINKFLWMVRIGGGEHPNEIQERDFLTPQGEYRIDNAASSTMLNCLMYKLSYYRFGEVRLDMRHPAGFDRTRNVEIGKKHFTLDYLEEAFTSEHWLVRIYKVKPPKNVPSLKRPRRRIRTQQSTKPMNNMRGQLKFNSRIVRGKRSSTRER
ncbi:Dolichyl-diphosphooligosaccharide--protein glycosyltransferase [Fasciola hepatica]|uniref:Dolichyl-diphosphooligosaccharide--protein glycosyltransferase n=1 Tax=Fasciola hepatica TaxID=6192 RepID=A0A4E0RYU8_FASHE|nr:Dolichyl-diphosphooligosaccharide--protein glycosyltransferase [Fasciola hepatica]